MKKIILFILLLLLLAGCTQASKVNHNLTQEADNFNVTRKVTIINCIVGDVLFQMEGRMSITADTVDNQLEVIVEYQKGAYQKHLIGLSDNVTYVIEDLWVNNVDEYAYTINFNPKFWIMAKPGHVD